MNNKSRISIWILSTLIIIIILIRGFFVVRIPANAVGIQVNAFTGIQDMTLNTGYHFKTPFDSVHELSTLVQTSAFEDVTTQTRDGQYLNTDVDIKWRVNQGQAMNVFKDYRTLNGVEEHVISPTVQRAIESVTGKYDVYDILGAERTKVYDEIDKALETELAKFNLDFVSFTITDQDAGDEIEKAIKNESVKQKEIDTALQEQEKAKVEAETAKIKAQAEADAKLIQAKGEADANAAINASITENVLKYMEMQARMEHGWVEVQTSGSVITSN